MHSPSEAGQYLGEWRMYYNEYCFGESIWVIIEVQEGGLLGVMQQMEHTTNWLNNNKPESSEARFKNPFSM